IFLNVRRHPRSEIRRKMVSHFDFAASVLSSSCLSFVAVMLITKNPIDVIRRKRTAIEKFLKRDIVDLLTTVKFVNSINAHPFLVLDLLQAYSRGL
ncbi:hypothetical protein HN51_070103, partial [Arachis hypogaea]